MEKESLRRNNYKMGLFSSIPIYINLYSNKAKVCRLDTGQCITRESKEKFSNCRVVLGEFEIAENFLKQIKFSKTIQPSILSYSN
jgi:hypothetical protein